MQVIHLRGMQLIGIIGFLLAHGQIASAMPYPWTLNHYQHTAFTKKDGAPQAVMNLAETSDGILWTDDIKGLVQFDGSRFKPFVPLAGQALPNEQIQRLFAPTTGGLWVAHDNGVSFINHGRVSNYGNNAGWVGRPASFFQDRQGALWAYAFPGLMKFAHGQWQRMDTQAPRDDIATIQQDEYFNLWATTKTGHLLVRRDGTADWVDTRVDVSGAIGISTAPGHSLFVSLRSHVIRRFVDGADGPVEIGKPIPYYARRVLVDQRGHVWVGTPQGGVHFLGPLSALMANSEPLLQDEKMDRTDGLTGMFASTYQDHNGNVWTGTEAGLDRFSPSPFSQLPLPIGITMISIAPTSSGDAWIGSENFAMFHLERGELKPTKVPWTAMATRAAPGGPVFAATADELWRLAPGVPMAFAKLPVTGIGKVRAMMLTANEEPWLSFRDRESKLAKLKNGKWEVRNDLGSPVSFHNDASGAIWAGYTDNHLARMSAATVKNYMASDGVAVGTVKVIADHGGVLWLAGEQHVQFFSGGVFTTLKLSGVKELSDISGMVFDQHGNLWLHTLSGLFRIDHADVERVLADHHYAIPYRLFDADDGLPGIPAQSYTLPTLTIGGDGRLWITGQTVAAWLDPDALPPPPRLSLPIIEHISDGKTSFDIGAAPLHLPKDARDLQISYTAVEMQFPARVRFKYRLNGFDSAWQDAGELRRASYPHLSAGNYTFEVRAAYEGQAWNNPPVAISFSIEPKYFETWWFRAMAAALMLLALWAAIQLQVRLATSRELKRMQIRLDEREVIARDLHDTLLQSTQSLVLQLDAIARNADNPVLKKRLNHLAQVSEEAITEARDKVQALRTHASSHEDFVEKLLRVGGELSEQHSIPFTAQLKGVPRRLDQHAAEQLLPIVSELLINAFRHSQARTVNIIIKFGLWRFSAAVCDDGIGLEETIWTSGAPHGHWGLKGVQERAARIGAKLALQSGRPCGTQLTVTLLSRRAYFVR